MGGQPYAQTPPQAYPPPPPEAYGPAVPQHHVAKTLIEEAKSLRPGEETWVAKMQVLIESVKHHAEEEESEMFSAVRSADAGALESPGAMDADRVVDPGEAEFIGGATIDMLVRGRTFRGRARTLTLRAPSRRARRVIGICGAHRTHQPAPFDGQRQQATPSTPGIEDPLGAVGDDRREVRVDAT